MPGKSSDAIVSSKAILDSLMEFKRHGSEEAMRRLEATEPELAEYLFESFSAIYQKLLELNGPFRKSRRVYLQVQTLALVSIQTLRHSHYQLWQGTDAGEGLESSREPSEAMVTEAPAIAPRSSSPDS